MEHFPTTNTNRQLTDEQEALSFGSLARRITLSKIDSETDPSEKKMRIMFAFEKRLITAEEAESWIVLAGLEEA